MEGADCWFLTLTCGRRDDVLLRAHAWHVLLTRLRQAWPEVQAWTVIEYSPRRGVHLHAVVKHAPTLSGAWLEHVVARLGDETRAHVTRVTDKAGLAHYLTKQLIDRAIMEAWPRQFRPVTTTRGWLPSWVGRRRWRPRTVL
jgi:hypothetical protein